MSADKIQSSGSVLIFGSGGHGAVVAEAAHAQGWHIAGFLDDAPDLHTCEKPLLDLATAMRSGAKIIVAIGDNAARERVFQRVMQANMQLVTIVHPTAFVSPSVTLGKGLFVGPRAVIHTQAKVGDGVIVNSGAIVEHHCNIAPFAHIAPAAAMGGRVSVGQRTLVGLGATVRQNISIGSDCLIAMGAAVVRNVPDATTVMGVPARPVRRI